MCKLGFSKKYTKTISVQQIPSKNKQHRFPKMSLIGPSRFYTEPMRPKVRDGITNSVDPEQTAT